MPNTFPVGPFKWIQSVLLSSVRLRLISPRNCCDALFGNFLLLLFEWKILTMHQEVSALQFQDYNVFYDDRDADKK
jgi:hypothetical protein